MSLVSSAGIKEQSVLKPSCYSLLNKYIGLYSKSFSPKNTSSFISNLDKGRCVLKTCFFIYIFLFYPLKV